MTYNTVDLAKYHNTPTFALSSVCCIESVQIGFKFHYMIEGVHRPIVPFLDFGRFDNLVVLNLLGERDQGWYNGLWHCSHRVGLSFWAPQALNPLTVPNTASFWHGTGTVRPRFPQFQFYHPSNGIWVPLAFVADPCQVYGCRSARQLLQGDLGMRLLWFI